VHRDLKPQNLLLTTNDDNAYLKIADFGFAREIEPENMAATFCGSPLYMAPEVIDGEKYNEKADLWSVGVILYEMFTGATPFMAFNLVQLSKQIKEKQVVYPATIPKDAVNLLMGLLQREPLKRLTFQQFFDHPFLRDFMKDNDKVSSSSAASVNNVNAINSGSSPNAQLPQQQQQAAINSPRVYNNIQIEQVPPKQPSTSPPANGNGNTISKAIPIRRQHQQTSSGEIDYYGGSNFSPSNFNNDLSNAAQSIEHTPPSFQMSMSPSVRAMLSGKQPKTSPFNAETMMENSFSPPADKYLLTRQSSGKLLVAPASSSLPKSDGGFMAMAANINNNNNNNTSSTSPNSLQNAQSEMIKTSLKHLVTITGSGHLTFNPVIFDFSKFATGTFETRDMNELVKYESYGRQAWAVAEAAYYYEKRKQLVEALSLYIQSMQLLQTILSEIKTHFHIDVSSIMEGFASVHHNNNGKNTFVVEAPERLAAIVAWTRNCYAAFMKRCEKIRARLEGSSADTMSLCTPEELLYHYAFKLGRDSGFEEYMADMTNCLSMCARGKLVFEYLLQHSSIAMEQADKDSLIKCM